MRYSLIIILPFVFLVTALSQDHQSLFKHLTVTDGLSNNWVRYIYMDDIGYMWFGTADGLNKYNGHEFKVYRPKTRNGKSLGDISVSAMLKKSTYELWVCTDLGVFIYNYLDDELHPFSLINAETILCTIIDKEKKFWFGTNNGLYRLDTDTKKVIRYVHNPADASSLSNSYINTIFEDSNANLWIGTKGGLNVLIKGKNSFRRYKPTDISIGISTNDILSICEDHNKRIWVGYAQDGLYVVKNNSVPDIEFKKIINGKIIRLLVDNRNVLWIGKGSGEGLDRIKLNNFSINKKPLLDHFQTIPQDAHSLSDNSIYSIYEDKFNDIWIGTFGNGLNYYSIRSKKFNVVNGNLNNNRTIKNNLINAIIEDENYLYIGTEAGLETLDKKSGIFAQYQNEPDNPNSLAANPVYALCKDSRGYIWAGTWAGGLNRFIPETKSFKRYLPNDKPGSISSTNVFSIYEDRMGNLWVGTIGGGLNRYNYQTDSFINYKNDKNDPNSLYSDMVNNIYQTSNGNLYVSVYNSLELYDYKNDNFTHYVHDVNDSTSNFGNILSIFEDSRKNIWIATNTGLEYFNEKEKSFTSIITEPQIPDNTIQGILEDDHGNLWISTNKGISKFINGIRLPMQPVIYDYTIEDGLSGNEFKKRSAYKNKQGIMYFGSSDGYTYFHPDSIKLNTIPPLVILSDFSVLNSLSGKNEKYKDITKHINFIEAVDLPYKNSDFIIRFAALNYLNPQNNHFKYKLEGYDSRWIDADNYQSARYTNLNAGRYVFMVLASNNDGVWCKSPGTLKIIIHPPWWKTRFFKIVIVLAVFLLLGVFYKMRFRILENQKKALEDTVQKRTKELQDINHLLEQQQEEITMQYEELSKYKNHLELIVEERTAALRASKEKAEESDRLKTAFLQNMSHEIRTPLNAILGFSDLLDDHFDDKETLAEFSNIIKQKGSDLLEIINEILDIARIESGSLGVTLESCNLNTLLTEIETFYKEYQKRLNKETIHFIMNNKGIDLNAEFLLDPGKIKQVFINLIGNAFKFTRAGTIEFGCCLYDANYLKFYVSDTGIGIQKEKQELIFERFRQINELNYREGAGLGLSISKGLIQLLGGEIWLTSELNKGTTFYFTIPYTKQQKV
jgi:signal transduction histidine kinase/ligand-binding sensor domain-containing protein